MSRDPATTDRFDDLRWRAEELVRVRAATVAEETPDVLALIHEIEVQYAELEIRNEELQRAQQELCELQLEAENLYEFAPCGYFTVNPRGIIERANLAAVTMLGLERSLLRVSAFNSFVAQASKDAFMDALWEAGRGGEQKSVELVLERKDGTSSWVRADIVADRNESEVVTRWRIVCTDITARKRTDERREIRARLLETVSQTVRAEDALRVLLEEIKEVTGLEAVGFRLKVGADFPYYETLGFPVKFVERESELCERTAEGELIRDSNGDPFLVCMCGSVLRGRTDPAQPFFTEGGSFWTNSTTTLLAETTEEDRQGWTCNGCNRAGYESVALIPLTAGNETSGLLQLNDRRPDRLSRETVELFEELGSTIGLLYRRKVAEEALRRANEGLETRVAERTSELERQRLLTTRTDRLRSLGEMAAGIAHELNQPLGGIRGLAEHLLLGIKRGWGHSEEQTSEKLQRILEQADRMSHVIEHVRIFSRDAGKPETRPIDVNEVVESALELLEVQLRAHVIDVRRELDPVLPPVMANPFSLEEVVLNCLTNARDAIEERREEGIAPDSPQRITLRTRREERDGGEKVVLEVRDTGCGVPVDRRERIFDPFFTTKGPDRGTGLGLSISRSIVEDLGGEIRLRCTDDGETEVTISLLAAEGE